MPQGQASKGHRPNMAKKRTRAVYKMTRQLERNKIRRIARELLAAGGKHHEILAARLAHWQEVLRKTPIQSQPVAVARRR
jgi:hypothetical protein